MNITKLSEELLLAVKTNKDISLHLKKLETLHQNTFENQLKNDDDKKAFWINIYNAFFQVLRQIKNVDKSKIYTAKEIKLAQQYWSLDDIEHGILRKYRYKYSLGYFPQLFPDKKIKKIAVSSIDYRIHFALNCGAESCPPIRFYSAEKINEQLDLATISFLESETEIFQEKKEIHISKLFKWFLGDFKSYKGIRNILKKYLDINTKGYKIIFKPYSWKEQLNNYSE